DSWRARRLLVSAPSSEEEVGRGGGALGHRAAVPSGARGGAGRMGGHGGGPPPPGLPAERAYCRAKGAPEDSPVRIVSYLLRLGIPGLAGSLGPEAGEPWHRARRLVVRGS